MTPPLLILHDDPHLLVLDKPAGMLVVAAPGRRGPTVVDAARAQLGTPVFAVHRLDEQTTGALMLAKTEAARVALEAMFRRHALERVYLAITVRVPSPAAGRIESRLREDAGGRVTSEAHGPGERAVTHYRTLCRTERGALVECRPETGRRNQIRVHLAELGCPIVGDRKYGFRTRAGPSPLGLCLHAWRLTCVHPMTATRLRVEAPLPAQFPPLPK